MYQLTHWHFNPCFSVALLHFAFRVSVDSGQIRLQHRMLLHVCSKRWHPQVLVPEQLKHLGSHMIMGPSFGTQLSIPVA